MKKLFLSLKKEPFDVMVTGEKDKEYRKTSKWLTSRLTNKDGTEKQYDLIHFTNGYGPDKRYFICLYEGVYLNTKPVIFKYTNDLSVCVNVGDTVICCGRIIERGNL